MRQWQIGLGIVGLVLASGVFWVSLLRLSGGVVLPEEVKVKRTELPEGVVLPSDPRHVAMAMGDWFWWRSVKGGTQERVRRLLSLADQRLEVAEVLIRASEGDELGVQVLERAEGYLDKAIEEGQVVGDSVDDDLENTVANHEAALEWAESEVEETLRPRVTKLKDECGNK